MTTKVYRSPTIDWPITAEDDGDVDNLTGDKAVVNGTSSSGETDLHFAQCIPFGGLRSPI